MINFLKKWFGSEVDSTSELQEHVIQDLRYMNGNHIHVKPKVVRDPIFSDIYGHDDLKVLFRNAIESREHIHILLSGAAGTAKSLFLEEVAHHVKHSYYIDNNSTGPGILWFLYEHPDLRFLCIDEIEKLRKDEVAVLLNLMETGKLIITKKTLMCNRMQKVSIFATCNNKDRMAPEMLSRFLKLHLKPYTYPEFNMITTNLATKRYNKTVEFADKVAEIVWKGMGSRDVRDCIKIMKLCKNIEDIEVIARTLKNYSEENATEEVEEEVIEEEDRDEEGVYRE